MLPFLNRRFRIMFGGLLGGLLLAAAASDAQQSQESTVKRPPSQVSQGLTEQVDPLVRYARAYLELAEVELRLAEESNRQIPGTHPRSSIARKENHVAVAKEQLRVAELGDKNGDASQVHLRYAEERARIAKRDYQQALEMKNRKQVYSDLQLQRLRLKAEVAEFRVALWSDPDNVLSALDHVHWQVERLSEEVIDLQMQLDELAKRPR